LDEASERRLEAGAVVVRPPSSDPETLRLAVADCDAMIVRTGTRVSQALLEAGRRLKVVGVAGVGLDNVDAAAAERLGIRVLHTPDAASDAVAEFTIALLLQLLRPIARLSERYRRGEFAAAREQPHGRELRELTVGIVGMGRIGSRVGRICTAFGARVIYCDIVDVGPFDFRATRVRHDELWPASDIVSLHVPLTELTRGMVSAQTISRFKPSALLINTARGGVLDAQALANALAAGQPAGAALDVTDPEPLPAGHPLWRLESCVLTPHVAARTARGLERMFAIVDDVLTALR
jgi:D-3-phosphoglycerate dehydrogenase